MTVIEARQKLPIPTGKATVLNSRLLRSLLAGSQAVQRLHWFGPARSTSTDCSVDVAMML